MGTVEDIGLRSTRIRTLDRTLVTVPNGQFSSMTLENFDRRDKMLFHFMLNIRHDTKPDQVRALLTSITKILADNPKLEPAALPVHFNGVGTYSLDLEISAYVLTGDPASGVGESGVPPISNFCLTSPTPDAPRSVIDLPWPPPQFCS